MAKLKEDLQKEGTFPLDQEPPAPWETFKQLYKDATAQMKVAKTQHESNNSWYTRKTKFALREAEDRQALIGRAANSYHIALLNDNVKKHQAARLTTQDKQRPTNDKSTTLTAPETDIYPDLTPYVSSRNPPPYAPEYSNNVQAPQIQVTSGILDFEWAENTESRDKIAQPQAETSSKLQQLETETAKQREIQEDREKTIRLEQLKASVGKAGGGVKGAEGDIITDPHWEETQAHRARENRRPTEERQRMKQEDRRRQMIPRKPIDKSSDKDDNDMTADDNYDESPDQPQSHDQDNIVAPVTFKGTISIGEEIKPKKANQKRRTHVPDHDLSPPQTRAYTAKNSTPNLVPPFGGSAPDLANLDSRGVGQYPLVQTESGKPPVYQPWKMRDMEILRNQLPDLHAGAGPWIRALEKTTGGQDLAIGDIRALVTAATSNIKMHQCDTTARTVATPDSDPFGEFRTEWWAVLRDQFPTKTDAGTLSKFVPKQEETPDEFLQRAINDWTDTTGCHPDHNPGHRLLFKAAIVKGIDKEVQMKLEDVVDEGMHIQTWGAYLKHHMNRYLSAKSEKDDEVKKLQTRLLKAQLKEVEDKLNKEKTCKQMPQQQAVGPVSQPAHPPQGPVFQQAGWNQGPPPQRRQQWGPKPNRDNRRDGRGGIYRSRRNPFPGCFICGDPSHWIAQCPYNTDQQPPSASSAGSQGIPHAAAVPTRAYHQQPQF